LRAGGGLQQQECNDKQAELQSNGGLHISSWNSQQLLTSRIRASSPSLPQA
jgi:hypothetical protein